MNGGILMSFLYVTEPDCKIYFQENQIVMEDKNGLFTKLPIETLEGVVLIGNVNITSGCQRELLKRGTPLTYLATNGQYYGRLESTRHINIERQRQQFRLGDDEAFCLEFAKKIIEAKSHNQIVVLRRYNRDYQKESVKNCLHDLELVQKKILTASHLAQLMGYEGNCARLYFQGLAQVINPRFSFKGRNKQPPKDPFNSLLSFGYTLLRYEVYGAIINKGLHPYAGFMHQDKRGHPALASDLMEEWRAVIVDALVMSLLNQDFFAQDDFTEPDEQGGVYLNREASKLFLKEYQKKLRVQTSYIGTETGKMSFRGAIQYQVNALTKAIEQKDLQYYQPFRIR
jgi:CRISPR-associated protein Cas1